MALIGEDCHFFLTSICARGNQCAFRHQPAALTTELTCPDWIKGKCLKSNCGLRHVPIDRTSGRKNTPCFFDNQPSGCLKPGCPFLHVKKTVTVAPTNAMQTQMIQPLHQNSNQIKQIMQSEQEKVPKIQPPSVPVGKAAIVQPTLVNGVLHLPSRGILGATPPGIQMVSQPMLVNQNGVPILQPSTQIVRQPAVVHSNQPQAPILQPANSNNVYPKSAHFNEQVRLFKEMLSTKQNYGRKPKDNKHYFEDDSEGDEEDDARKHKDKQRNHKSRKSKKDKYSVSKGKKKSKDDWMDEADKEVLYNDYKDVPLEKKHKRSKPERKADSDSDVNVKSYEDILREKALRKLMEKRKEKFNNDFDDIIQSTETIDKGTKKYSSDGDETVDTKRKRRKSSSRKASIDLGNEVFSQEDAVELEILDDEFSTETEEEKNKRKHGRDRKRKTSKSNHDPPPSEQKTKTTSKAITRKQNVKKETIENELKKKESTEAPTPEPGVMIIPDETTDINFSVDDDDELALELNNENEFNKRRSSKKNSSLRSSSKNISSIVGSVSKKTEMKTKSSSNVSKKEKLPPDSPGNEKPKRKIMVVDSPVTSKKSKDNNGDGSQQTEKKKVISLSRKKTGEKVQTETESVKEVTKPKTDIKIKTFEEIMAEKRKRKFRTDEVVVVSDNDITSPDSPIKKRSEIVKSKVLTTREERKEAEYDLNPPKTAAQLRREKLKQAKEEYEKRRKSQQFYKPKIPMEEKEDYDPPVKTTSNTTSTIAAVIAAVEAKKVKLSRVPLANTVATKDEVKIRSFEEIMEEKRLRKKGNKHQSNPVRGRIDSKPIQSFLRRTVSDRSVRSTPETTKSFTPLSVSTSKTATTTTSSNKANNSTRVASSLPAMISGATSDNKLQANDYAVISTRTSSAPVKLKRFSASENDLSPLTERKTSSSDNSVVGDHTAQQNIMSLEQTSVNEPSNGLSVDVPEPSMEDIKEALKEKKRMREEDILSDDEFEKEMNFLSDADEGNDDTEDVDDDDFMMELQQMIDS